MVHRLAGRAGTRKERAAARSGPRASRPTAADDEPTATQVRRAGRVDAGIDELDRWLADQVRQGIAGAGRAGYRHWDAMAERLVDAQAPALASGVRRLAAFAGFPDRLLAELGLLRLAVTGWRRQDSLPADLVDNVRGRIGFPVSADDVLAGDGGARRVGGDRHPRRDRPAAEPAPGLAAGRRHGPRRARARRSPRRARRCRATTCWAPASRPTCASTRAAATSGRWCGPGTATPRAVVRAARPATRRSPTRCARYAGSLADNPWQDRVPMLLDAVTLVTGRRRLARARPRRRRPAPCIRRPIGRGGWWPPLAASPPPSPASGPPTACARWRCGPTAGWWRRVTPYGVGWPELLSAALVGTDRHPLGRTRADRPRRGRRGASCSTRRRRGASTGGPAPDRCRTWPHPTRRRPSTRTVVVPAAAARLALLAGAGGPFDGGTRAALLDRVAGAGRRRTRRRVPPEFLPDLFELSRFQARRAAAGPRGRRGTGRLAGRAEPRLGPARPGRDGAGADGAAEVGSSGSMSATGARRPGSRRAYLVARRRADPAAAVALLERRVGRDGALDERLDLLDGARRPARRRATRRSWSGRSNDRRADVRRRAADLLGALPGSDLNRRMAVRAARATCASRTARLTSTPPTGRDAAMARDGVSDPPAGAPRRAWWLAEVLARTPLAALTTLPPAQFLALPHPTSGGRSLLRALAAGGRPPAQSTVGGRAARRRQRHRSRPTWPRSCTRCSAPTSSPAGPWPR